MTADEEFDAFIRDRDHHRLSVWVVERVAVYHQGVVAVFTSRNAAESFVSTVRPDTDGHHGWLCSELVLDFAPESLPLPAEDDLDYEYPGHLHRLTSPGDVTLKKYRAADGDEWVPLGAEA